MRIGFARVLERVLLSLLVLAGMAEAVLAGPPLPPASAPSVPVGGAGVTVATTLAIAVYGLWKSRK